MKLSELAKQVGYSHAHITRLAGKGEIPGCKTTKGGHWRVPRSYELSQWIIRNQKKPLYEPNLEQILSNLKILGGRLGYNDFMENSAMIAFARDAVAKIRKIADEIESKIVEAQKRDAVLNAHRESLARSRRERLALRVR